MEQLGLSKNYIKKIYFGTVITLFIFIFSLTLYGCHTTGGAKTHPHIKGEIKELEPPEENKDGNFYTLEKHSAKKRE